MTEIEKRFQGATTMVAVIRTSRALEADGFDKAEVNLAATKRRRDLLTLSSEAYQRLEKVLAPVLDVSPKLSRLNTDFRKMNGSTLCIVQGTGEFVWK